MLDQSLRQRLIDLLDQTEAAHLKAHLDTDGADPEWPFWYAAYLQARLGPLLNAAVTQSKLVQLLVSVSEEQEKNAPGEDWRGYYADFFLAHYPIPDHN